MIRIPLHTEDGRTGALMWTSGSAPVLDQGSLTDEEVAEVLKVMRTPVQVPQLDVALIVDGGHTEAITVVDRTTFLYVAGEIVVQTGILPDWPGTTEVGD